MRPMRSLEPFAVKSTPLAAPLLGEAHERVELALDPLQLGAHDRYVHEDQGDEDTVGTRHVLSGFVEWKRGHPRLSAPAGQARWRVAHSPAPPLDGRPR